MPRYLIERSYPAGPRLMALPGNAEECAQVVAINAEEGVTWIHSYIPPDQRSTFCVYDGPSPEAIRRAAQRNRLPVTRIVEVRVLDPYFHPVGTPGSPGKAQEKEKQ